MNPELYTDEARHFKYLKCTPAAVEFYKKTQDHLNKIRPEDQEDNPNFSWSSRLEFIEQIIDLRNDDLYIVEPGELVQTVDAMSANAKMRFTYEDAKLIHIEKPMLYSGHPVNPKDGRQIEFDDIRIIEDDPTAISRYFLCSGNYLDPQWAGRPGDIRIFNLQIISLVSRGFVSYMALFYNKQEALEYKQAITKFLRRNSGAISAISRLV